MRCYNLWNWDDISWSLGHHMSDDTSLTLRMFPDISSLIQPKYNFHLIVPIFLNKYIQLLKPDIWYYSLFLNTQLWIISNLSTKYNLKSNNFFSCLFLLSLLHITGTVTTHLFFSTSFHKLVLTQQQRDPFHQVNLKSKHELLLQLSFQSQLLSLRMKSCLCHVLSGS